MRSLFLVMLLSLPVLAQEDPAPAEEKAPSPWLLTPLLSSSPKTGTAVKVMGAYVSKFDPVSPASMTGVMLQYSNTDSTMATAFFRGFLLEDRLRLNAMLMAGRINNAYADFLGSGYPAETRDDIHMGAVNALWRIYPNLYAGGQFVATNYVVTGDDDFSQGVLEQLNLTGFKSVGAGVTLQYDTRDNVNSPNRGQSAKLSNLAFSKSLGGDFSFQNYSGYWRAYFPFLDGSAVLASQAYARWTYNAPPSGLASVHMRGYTQGQYLGEQMTSVEAEWRQAFSARWGGEVFAGVAHLAGGDLPSLGDYPGGGVGLYYMLRPQDGMALCLEAAWGKAGNYGIYLRFGHAF